MKTALLFSGGLDSTALLYWKKPDMGIFINYGQSSFRGELRAVKKIASELNFEVVQFSSGSINNIKRTINKENSNRYTSKEWIPYRNQLLITYAGIISFAYGLKSILIGCVKSDGHYKDGTKEFFTKVNDIFRYQEGSIKIKAPSIGMSTVELIKKSKIPISIISWSHSCTKSEIACGVCPSCRKHQMVMSEIHSIKS